MILSITKLTYSPLGLVPWVMKKEKKKKRKKDRERKTERESPLRLVWVVRCSVYWDKFPLMWGWPPRVMGCITCERSWFAWNDPLWAKLLIFSLWKNDPPKFHFDPHFFISGSFGVIHDPQFLDLALPLIMLRLLVKFKFDMVVPFFQKQGIIKKKKKKKKRFPLKPDDMIVMSSNVHEWKGKPRSIVRYQCLMQQIIRNKVTPHDS